MKIPVRPPAVDLSVFDGGVNALMSAFAQVDPLTDPYRSWEEMRWRRPPGDLTREQWWQVTSMSRRGASRELPLRQIDGTAFRYTLTDEALRLIEKIRSRAGGAIAMDEPVVDEASRDRYLVNSLIEESITSSQLEGATTTGRVAREMLRTGRSPRDRSELMIWNNYQAMEFVREHREETITPELVVELHALVTAGTLDNPDDAGRLQRPGDDRVVVTTPENDVVHVPPPARELAGRLVELCAFASGTADDAVWISPVARAVFVHFMVGHDHSFADGNGRLARALFYWVMLREGMWLTEFVTISTIIKAAPVKYAHAYLNSEYEGDATFFLLYHLRVVDQAFDALELYLARKMSEARDVRHRLRERRDLNHRQIAVLERAIADSGAEFTAASHRRSHRVSDMTARGDLEALEAQGFLARTKRGRTFVWYPVPGLPGRLDAGSS